MSDEQPPPDSGNEAFWYDFLTVGSPNERRNRRIFRLLPHGPRCRFCATPFAGAAAPVMRMIGKRPADHNPNWCSLVLRLITEHHGGAEVELSLLFADIRGSTGMAEGRSPSAYRAILDRFYDVAAQAIIDYDGFIDKFVGDEVVAIFAPLLAGEQHTAQAIEAAKALLRNTGHDAPEGPWVALGAGVHTGVAWMGAVGEGPHTALTAWVTRSTSPLASPHWRSQARSLSPPTRLPPPVSAMGWSGGARLAQQQQQTEVVALQIGPVRSTL